MRLVIFSLLIMITFSCHPYKLHKINGIDLDIIPADSTFRLRSDGIYNTIGVKLDTLEEKFKIITPLVILNSRKAVTINDASISDTTLDLENYFLHSFKDYVGDYVVHNDTIWAKLLVIFIDFGEIPKTYECYFQGILKIETLLSIGV